MYIVVGTFRNETGNMVVKVFVVDTCEKAIEYVKMMRETGWRAEYNEATGVHNRGIHYADTTQIEF